MIKLAPSLLAADPLNLGDQLERAEKAGCDWFHIDVMDGHFVPNITFGPAMVGSIKKAAHVPLDVHLMISDPDRYLEVFAKNGSDYLTIHAEIPGDAAACLKRIRTMGMRPGLAIKPGTSVEQVKPLLALCDLAVVMTVEPGFGGQRFMPECAAKIAQLREAGFEGLIECDGGVSGDNVAMLAELGLDVAVMGTAFFRSEDPAVLADRCHALS